MSASRPVRLSRNTIPLLFFGMGFLLIATSVYFFLKDVSPPDDLSAVPVPVNFAAPELALTDTQGVSHSLADYRGQVVLVNLWATWCPPCKEEMPTLQAFYDKYKNKGFAIVAVDDGDPTGDVLQFAKDHELTFSVWLDPTNLATEQAFKTLNLPSSYVVDRDGTVKLMWVGGINRKTLEKQVTPLILEKQ